MKYDPDGDALWVARYNGPDNSGDSAAALALDESGSVYVTGPSIGTDSGLDYATVKYNPSGDEVWTIRYNGPANGYDAARAVAVDGSGSVYVTGPSAGIDTDDDFATVKYTEPPVHHSPVAQADNFVAWQGCTRTITAPGVLNNDQDVDGDLLSAVLVQTTSNGTLTLSGDGSFDYTPNPGATTDSFTYQASDGTLSSTPVTVTLTILTDTAPPSALAGPGTNASATRVYVPLTVADGESGVAQVSLTSHSRNCRLEWDGPSGLVTTAIGTPLPITPVTGSTTVRIVALNAKKPARAEVQITDCLGNSKLVKLTFARLEVKAGSVVQLSTGGLTDAEHYLVLRNGTPGLSNVQVSVNGKPFYTGTLSPGGTLRRDFGAQVRAGKKNTVLVRGTGARGVQAVLTIGDASLFGGAD